MIELEISIITTPNKPGLFEDVLDEFEKRTGIHVILQKQNWDTAWNEITHNAIYRTGPDISEIGTTWISDLVIMDVLHPFSKSEIHELTASEPFLEPSWQACVAVSDQKVWAIPWLADSRVIYYRQDLLEKAGINPDSAFETPESLIQNFSILLERFNADPKWPAPWVVPTQRCRNTLHHIASWVWKAGGDFLSPDGRTAMFHKPESIDGFARYFELGRYLAKEAHNLDIFSSDEEYIQGRAAATISGQWLLCKTNMLDVVAENTAIAFPFGVPFVGGSSLMIWHHTAHPREALALVNYLTSPEVQRKCRLEDIGLFSTRKHVLDEIAHQKTSLQRASLYEQIIQGLESGRSFHLAYLWGMSEERLNNTLGHIWEKVLQNPTIDPRKLITRELSALARRLNLALNGIGT